MQCKVEAAAIFQGGYCVCAVFAIFTHNVRWQSGAGDHRSSGSGSIGHIAFATMRPHRSEKTTMKPKKNREQSKSKIKAAALHLFATKGYSNTSLEEIANAAGFTKGGSLLPL